MLNLLKSKLAALTDGVFSIAATLMLLDFRYSARLSRKSWRDVGVGVNGGRDEGW